MSLFTMFLSSMPSRIKHLHAATGWSIWHEKNPWTRPEYGKIELNVSTGFEFFSTT